MGDRSGLVERIRRGRRWSGSDYKHAELAISAWLLVAGAAVGSACLLAGVVVLVRVALF